MYEKFSQQALIVVVAAQEHSRQLCIEECDTGNLLLALWTIGKSAQILKATGVSNKKVRDTHKKLLQKQSIPFFERLKRRWAKSVPWTQHSKEVLKRSYEISENLGCAHVDTEHLLLGVIDLNEGLTRQIFDNFKIDTVQLKEQILLSG
jgi:ATP-dependent Clp protease ATP-binding subunit ClpC